MDKYKSFTNSELEEELKRLKQEYDVAQSVVLENYRLMLQLAEMYGQVEDILNIRTGKKKL